MDAITVGSWILRSQTQSGSGHRRHHGLVGCSVTILRKDQTLFSDGNRPWPPSQSGRGSSVLRLRTDQIMDAIMVWLDPLSLFSEKDQPCSQTGIDHGRHHGRVVDPPFSKRLRPWTQPRFGWMLYSQKRSDDGCRHCSQKRSC